MFSYTRTPSGTEIETLGSSEFVDFEFIANGDDTSIFYEWNLSDPETLYYALRAYTGYSNFDPYVQTDCLAWTAIGENNDLFTADLPLGDYYKVRIMGFNDSTCETQTASGSNEGTPTNVEDNAGSIIFSVVEATPPTPTSTATSTALSGDLAFNAVFLFIFTMFGIMFIFKK